MAKRSSGKKGGAVSRRVGSQFASGDMTLVEDEEGEAFMTKRSSGKKGGALTGNHACEATAEAGRRHRSQIRQSR